MSSNLYAKALIKWGLDSQLDMCQEEAAELIMAINKLRRSKYRRKSSVAEEIADTYILIEQVILGLEIDKSVKKWKELKLKRLERRLK